MKVAGAHADVEAACPGFFHSIEMVVAGEDIDAVADNLVSTVDTEKKCEALGACLSTFQTGVNVLRDEDEAWLLQVGTPLCLLLAERSALLRLRRASVESPPTMAQLADAVRVWSQMKKYADACRFILGTLHQRAHIVEHHWDDLPLA